MVDCGVLDDFSVSPVYCFSRNRPREVQVFKM